MEPQALHAALTATLSQNQSERQAAETVLKSLDATPGYLPCLFQIINSSEVAPEVKQAGIIYFKNLVSKHWQREHEHPHGGVVFSEEDKRVVRSGLLDALLVSNNLTRPQILQSLRTIASNDFPHKMPGFLEQLSQNLDPALQHPDRAMASLRALRALCKVYEYRTLERRQAPVHAILTATFPQLASILEIVLSGNPAEEASAEVLKIGIKTLCSVVHQSLPHFLQNEAVFMRWMTILYRTLEIPIPAALAGATSYSGEEEERSKAPLWKAKQWTAQVIQRLMSKYGNLKQAEKMFSKEEKAGELAISHIFHHQLAVRFLNLQLQVLSAKSQGVFLPEQLVVRSCSYIMSAVTLAITWQQLKQNVMPLVTHVIFPVLCFESRDRALWEEDPIEFVRTIYDVMEDYTSQRVQCARLLVDLCQKRPSACLLPMLNFSHDVLVSTSQELEVLAHAGGDSAATLAAASRKDGGMYLLGCLHNQLSDSAVQAECGEKVQWLVKHYIAPDLQSPIHHLRGRACWAMGHLFVLLDKSSDFYIQVLRCVIQMLRDPELPVRFQACVSLRYLIYDADNRCAWKSVESDVAQVLPHIMESLFAVMDEVGSDELVQSLDVLIEIFASRMPPYAQGLCHRLSETFLRLAASDDADTDSSLAASQCLTAVSTLLDAVREGHSPHLFASIEESLLPLLRQCLQPDPAGEYCYREFIEDVLEIMTRLSYYAPSISERLWTLYLPLTKCFTDWAMDYLCEFQVVFHNYVSRAPEDLVSTPERPQALFRMMQRVFEYPDAQDKDIVQVCLLAQSMVLYTKGAPQMLQYIQPLVALVVQRLKTQAPKKEHARSELIKVIAACLLVSPAETLSAAESLSATHMVFQIWLECIVVLGEKDTVRGKETIRTHFRSLNDKKLCIIGLASILRTPRAQLPASIQEGMGHLLAALITLFFDMDVVRRRRLAAHERAGALEGVIAQLQDSGGTGGGSFWEDEDDQDGLEEDDDDECTPIDAIDEVLFFAEASSGILSANPDPEVQGNILKTLDDGQRGFMQSVLASVPARLALRQGGFQVVGNPHAPELSGAAAVVAGAES